MPETYNWKDSNMALFGSDIEQTVKLESAQSEPAWDNSGTCIGLEIWRIVKFQVERWPKDDYGSFFEGDSYIILNTYQNPDEADYEYDVHFWIGKYSTQDEYGTAAYKTVELDTFHGDKPVQHREVQNNESALFKSYFESVTYLKGGAESGFRHVRPTEYIPRLFRFRGDTFANTVMAEVGLIRQNLTDHDLFVLDAGLMIYTIIGRKCDKDIKMKATYHVIKLRDLRNGRPKSCVVDDDPTTYPEIMDILMDGDAEVEEAPVEDTTRRIMKISDSQGEMKMDFVAEGNISQDMLEPADVFLVDLGKHLYVWVGNDASPGEKKNGMTYAHNYLNEKCRCHCPVTIVSQGRAMQLYKEL